MGLTAPARAAVAGLYTNVATVQGTSSGKTLFDNDPASYFGWVVQLHVVKATNAARPGPSDGARGRQHRARPDPLDRDGRHLDVPDHERRQPRRARLADRRLRTASNTADDFPPAYVKGDTNGNGLLTRVRSGLRVDGTYNVKDSQYVNIATASTTAPDGSTVAAAIAATRRRLRRSGSALSKAVNAADPWHPTHYEDANSPLGPIVTAGSAVTWTYLVRNDGTVAIRPSRRSPTTAAFAGSIAFLPVSVNTIDPLVRCNDGDVNGNCMLDPGESWLYRASGAAPLGQYENTATANGVAFVGGVPTMVTATDVAYLYGTVDHPKIVVVKKINGADANTPGDAVFVKAGAAVTWTYDVSAPDATLDHVSLIDDNGTPEPAATTSIRSS